MVVKNKTNVDLGVLSSVNGFVEISASSSSTILSFTFLRDFLLPVAGLANGLGVRYLEKYKYKVE